MSTEKVNSADVATDKSGRKWRFKSLEIGGSGIISHETTDVRILEIGLPDHLESEGSTRQINRLRQ